MAGKKQDPQTLDQDKTLAAVLALMVAEREDRIAAASNGKGAKTEARTTETILASAGLTATEIAPLVGKNLEAVRKTIQRGKAR